MINPCGVNCAECGYFKKECPGCREVEGKTFWAVEYYENQLCPIYKCCVNEKEYEHCGQCALLPCHTFTDLRDPSMSDDEYESSLNKRLEELRKAE
ncbi:MAG TPA: DUF3795 domain-containing protein [Clostridiales bacterium]|nr:DUF3795 domain-containing protein [Clostridiales bacterium]HQP69750.1 DUF3795 domain-containing protein [Clostridiales bacterium]